MNAKWGIYLKCVETGDEIAIAINADETMDTDKTATDMLFERVDGTEPVNKLRQSYGLNTIKATGPTSTWFKALRNKVESDDPRSNEFIRWPPSSSNGGENE